MPRTYYIDDNTIGLGHVDRGCSYAPKCLECDLVLCRDDLPGGLEEAIYLTAKIAAEKARRVEFSHESS